MTASIADRAAGLMLRFEAAHHAAATYVDGVRRIADDPAPMAELLAVHHEAGLLAADFRGAATAAPTAADGVARIRSTTAGVVANLGQQLFPSHYMDDWAHPAAMDLWTGLAELHAAAGGATPAERATLAQADIARVVTRAHASVAEATPARFLDFSYDHRYNTLRGAAYRSNEAADVMRGVATLSKDLGLPAAADAEQAVGHLGAESTWQSSRWFTHTPRQALQGQLAALETYGAAAGLDLRAPVT